MTMSQPSVPLAGSPTIEARLLGGCALRYAGRALPQTAFRRRRALTLLLYLLSVPTHRLPREAVLETLWPEGDPAAANAGLRVLLTDLRAILGPGPNGDSPLLGRGPLIGLHPALTLRIDAADFEAAATAALASGDPLALRAAAALYGGPFLPDFAYEEWALARRRLLAGLQQRLLSALATHEAVHDPPAAEGHLRDLLAASPTDEASAQALMDLLAAVGRRAEALRVYQALATALHEDLGVAPDPQTEARRARLLAGAPAAASDHRLEPALPTAPANLPAPLTSFVGREWEQAEIRGLLQRLPAAGRLLTLTGPGGCGKTRLALAVAGALLPRYPGGVWLVELAVVPAGDNPAPVLLQIAAALGLQDRVQGAPSAPAALAAALQATELLLLLDNCEHVVAACADVAASLLAACPGLHILATSREALGILGETTWLVPPLSLPPEAGTGPADERALARLVQFEALRLFLERARAAQAGFALTARNAPAIAHICRTLDGIPLAIELAASQVRLLSVEELAVRLDDRFRLLTSGNRGALPRHRTLRAAMDWSYALLDGAERALLRRLAIFAASCTLAAAEAVCTAAPMALAASPGVAGNGPGIAVAGYAPAPGVQLDVGAVLEVLSRLVSKSLVVVEQSQAGGPTRYGLLETVRQYGRQRLEAAGEALIAERRLQHWCLALVEEAAAALVGHEQGIWLERLQVEHANVRAALTCSLQRGQDPALGVRLVMALWRFWEIRGYWTEGRHWVAAALASGAEIAPASRALLLNRAGSVALYQGDYDQATTLYEDSLAIRRALGDRLASAASLNNLGIVAYYRGDFPRARAFHEESSAIKRELDDPSGLACTLNNLGNIAESLRQFDRAEELYRESVALWRRVGDTVSVAYGLNNLGTSLRQRGDEAGAAALFEESLALFRDLGERWGIAAALNNLGVVACARGDLARAEALYRQSLAHWHELGDKEGVAESLQGWANLALKRGLPERAARLLAAVESLRAAIGAPHTPTERAAFEETLRAARAMLDERSFTVAWQAGLSLSLDQGIVLATAEPVARALPAALRAEPSVQ